MLGYWDEPGRTAEVIDAGRLDAHRRPGGDETTDGYVQIVGRIKDMIIRGGENVYPREIEEFLYTHPKIADVQVVGVPDEKYGEEVVACVIPRDPADPPTPRRSRRTAASRSRTTRCRAAWRSWTRSR